MRSQEVITLAEAGVLLSHKALKRLDSGLHRNDGEKHEQVSSFGYQASTRSIVSRFVVNCEQGENLQVFKRA